MDSILDNSNNRTYNQVEICLKMSENVCNVREREKIKKIAALTLALFLIASTSACGETGGANNAPEEETITFEPDSGRTPEEAMDVLIWQIEPSLSSSKYDGYTLDYDDIAITINVWKESITNTANLVIESGGGQDNEDWVWLKNNAKNTADYIYDCIRTSELSDLTLYFNVLDDTDQSTVLFAFTNTDITYDIMAE